MHLEVNEQDVCVFFCVCVFFSTNFTKSSKPSFSLSRPLDLTVFVPFYFEYDWVLTPPSAPTNVFFFCLLEIVGMSQLNVTRTWLPVTRTLGNVSTVRYWCCVAMTAHEGDMAKAEILEYTIFVVSVFVKSKRVDFKCSKNWFRPLFVLDFVFLLFINGSFRTRET